jgi:hypothetical protein
VGDWHCCPLNYFYDFFKDYNIMRHDIDYIEWERINRCDIVIIGAGGMLDVTASFNANINRLLDKCETVIAWSIGFNTHDTQWFQGENFEPVKFNKFKLISIRDYHHKSGLDWLPCPSALAPEFAMTSELKRKIGIIEHQNLPIIGLPYDKISNAYNLHDVVEFITSSEVIVTNSYHMVYFSQLLRKKVVVYNKFSTKFDCFKYQPEFVECKNNDWGGG